MENEPFRFQFPMTVRFADTDCQGHVFFGTYFTYLDEAFMAYLAELGYSWEELIDLGYELYYVESSCQYQGRSFYGNELSISVRVSHVGNTSLKVDLQVNNIATDERVAVGKLAAVVVDMKTSRPSAVPSEVRRAIELFESGKHPR